MSQDQINSIEFDRETTLNLVRDSLLYLIHKINTPLATLQNELYILANTTHNLDHNLDLNSLVSNVSQSISTLAKILNGSTADHPLSKYTFLSDFANMTNGASLRCSSFEWLLQQDIIRTSHTFVNALNHILDSLAYKNIPCSICIGDAHNRTALSATVTASISQPILDLQYKSVSDFIKEGIGFKKIGLLPLCELVLACNGHPMVLKLADTSFSIIITEVKK